MKSISPRNILMSASILALLLAGALTLTAQKPDSKQITDLFAEMKQHATLAEDDANLLESYTRSGVSWESHARALDTIKEHVNALGVDYKEAIRLRDEGSPWQREAIDRVGPLLQGMASHLTATLEHHGKNPSHVRMQPYRDYVLANQQYAARTSALIRDLVDYGEAKAKSEELERKLELPTGSGTE